MATFLDYAPDAVMVVSPNYLHAQHSLAMLEAGKHVLVEKPMALTARDCDAMITAAEANNVVLAVGLEMRVFTLFRAVKDLLDNELGTPLHVQLDLTRRPYRAGAGGWKSDPDKLGNAILKNPFTTSIWHGGICRLTVNPCVCKRGQTAAVGGRCSMRIWMCGSSTTVAHTPL